VKTLVGIPVLAYGVDEMVRGRRSCRQVAWQLSGKVVHVRAVTSLPQSSGEVPARAATDGGVDSRFGANAPDAGMGRERSHVRGEVAEGQVWR
jgi:hypothetical protein